MSRDTRGVGRGSYTQSSILVPFGIIKQNGAARKTFIRLNELITLVRAAKLPDNELDSGLVRLGTEDDKVEAAGGVPLP